MTAAAAESLTPPPHGGRRSGRAPPRPWRGGAFHTRGRPHRRASRRLRRRGAADHRDAPRGRRHPGGGGFRVRHRPPRGCAVTAGPGFTNSVTGFADAAVSNVPLVMIAGRTALKRRGRGAVQDVDQEGMLAPHRQVAGGRLQCPDPPPPHRRGLPPGGRRAGPARSTSRSPTTCSWPGCSPPAGPWGFPTPPPRSAASPADLERAIEALRTAARPIVLAGGGAFWSGAGEEIAAFCTAAEIPVTTTSSARGLVADSPPLVPRLPGPRRHGGRRRRLRAGAGQRLQRQPRLRGPAAVQRGPDPDPGGHRRRPDRGQPARRHRRPGRRPRGAWPS